MKNGIWLLVFILVAEGLSPFVPADTVYLNTTSNLGVGGTDFNYLGTAGASLVQTTSIKPRFAGDAYYFDPLTAAGTGAWVVPASINTVAPLYGWATSQTFTGTISSGAWRFNTTTLSTTTTGTIYLNISVWKTCGSQDINTWLFTASNNTDLTSITTALWLLTSANKPEFTFGEDYALKIGYYAYTQTGTGSGTQTISFRTNTPSFFVIFPQVYRKLVNVTLDAPASDVSLIEGSAFPMGCTALTDNSTNGIHMEFQYNTSTTPFVPIPNSAAALTTPSNTVSNIRNNTQATQTVTANAAGEYFVRCRLYNASSSVYSAARKVTINPAVAAANLEIWDQTDPKDGNIPAIAGDNIKFYANYTNAATGAPLSGASCQIAFEDTGYAFAPAAYNPASTLFEAIHVYASAGTFAFNVSCAQIGFQSKLNNDTITVQPGPTVGSNKDSYSSCGYVFYEVKLYDKDEQLFTPAIQANLTVRNSTDKLQENSVSVTGGVYQSSYLLPPLANSGDWLIKALSGALGNKIFHVRTGNGDVWKIDVLFNETKGGYLQSEGVKVSANVWNLKGRGVSGLQANGNLLVYLDDSQFSPAVTDHANGTYSFLLDFSAFTPNTPHVLKVMANASNVNVTATRGFYVS